MDSITTTFKEYHAQIFEKHGATARGVDWRDEDELLVRYDKMLDVLRKDFLPPLDTVSLLDVGCGWGGLARRAIDLKLPLAYSGIDVVESMVAHAKTEFESAEFIHGDVFAMPDVPAYDFVVCNAILTQKLGASNMEMEQYSRKLIHKMFSLCRHGVAFNMMSTRVNFMVGNLYYQNPAELFTWLLTDVAPRVRFDHGYSSLASGKGKYYDFTVYVYKD